MSQRLSKLVSTYNEQRDFFVAKKSEYNSLLSRNEQLNTEIGELEGLSTSLGRLGMFFQSLGTEEQARLQAWMERVVTYGLQCVFGETYRFKIIGPEVARNEVVLSFMVEESVVENGVIVQKARDPFTSLGGGVADVLSFLLQFVLVFLLRDRVQQVIFLDEAMKHLSEGHRPAVAKLMSDLVDKTGVQVILITHSPVYQEYGDCVYRFEKDLSGSTSAVKLK